MHALTDLGLKLYLKARWFRDMLHEQGGQDLIEYALVISLIALAATVGMKTLATKIATAFTNIGTKLNSYTS